MALLLKWDISGHHCSMIINGAYLENLMIAYTHHAMREAEIDAFLLRALPRTIMVYFGSTGLTLDFHTQIFKLRIVIQTEM